jgi:hypothetical protein
LAHVSPLPIPAGMAFWEGAPHSQNTCSLQRDMQRRDGGVLDVSPHYNVPPRRAEPSSDWEPENRAGHSPSSSWKAGSSWDDGPAPSLLGPSVWKSEWAESGTLLFASVQQHGSLGAPPQTPRLGSPTGLSLDLFAQGRASRPQGPPRCRTAPRVVPVSAALGPLTRPSRRPRHLPKGRCPGPEQEAVGGASVYGPGPCWVSQ